MAAMAAKVGCDVSPNITKKTTLLVIGTQNTEKLKGKDRSSKQIKAEQLIQEGASIRILTEADFITLLEAAM
jgi:DNA polymerase-3 subunit epsilon